MRGSLPEMERKKAKYNERQSLIMSNAAQDLLQKNFQEALALQGEVDWDSLHYQSIPSWDSLGHMRLIAAIEGAFDLMLTTDEILDLSSFEKAQEILRGHGIRFEP